MAREVWLVIAAGLLNSMLWGPGDSGAQGPKSAAQTAAEKSQSASQEKASPLEAVGAVEAELAALKERVQKLEGKLEELRGQAMLLERVEEIKQVTEYICPQGHLYDQPRQGGHCPIDGLVLKERRVLRKMKFARPESLSENIEAVVGEQMDKRLFFSTSVTAVGQHTLGSRRDKLLATASADLFFFARPLLNTTLFIDLEAIGGEGPDAVVSSVSGLNEDVSRGSSQDQDGVDRLGVREAWVRGSFLQDRLSVIAGKIDLLNYFDANAVANDETTQFLTSAFVNSALLGSPLGGVLPPNSPGGALFWHSPQGWYWGAGLQSRRNSGSTLTRRPFSIVEGGYRGPLLLSRPGSYRLWAGAPGPLSITTLVYGLSLDQELNPAMSLFARYGHGAGPDYAWSVGMEWRAPFAARPRDRLALAFGRHRIASRAAESVGEIYYSFFLTDHLRVSPHVQLLFERPQAGRDVLTVFGTRTQIDF